MDGIKTVGDLYAKYGFLGGTASSLCYALFDRLPRLVIKPITMVVLKKPASMEKEAVSEEEVAAEIETDVPQPIHLDAEHRKALESNYYDSRLETHRVEHGEIRVWHYRHQGIFRGIFLPKKKYSRMLGARVTLPDVACSQNCDAQEALQRFKICVEDLCRPVDRQKPEARPARAATPRVVADVEMREVTPSDTQAKQPVAVTEKSSHHAKPPHIVVPANMKAPTKVLSHRGRLVSAGVEKRPDRKKPSGSYDCYCVRVADESVGVVIPLWGSDLERALEESGAIPGDRIEVSVVGEVPVALQGNKSGFKRVWTINLC